MNEIDCRQEACSRSTGGGPEQSRNPSIPAMISKMRNAGLLAATLAIVGMAGCATRDTGGATIPRGGDDCFWANSTYSWRPVDDEKLIVWSPSRSCPYLVEFVRRCNGIRFTDDIAFHDRDGRICPYGGDAVIVPGPSGDRCSIASITRLTPDDAAILLGEETPSIGASDRAGACSPDAEIETLQDETITSADIGEPEEWGAAKNVVRVKHLYFSSQPDQETLRLAREKGVGVVINFRPAAELDWDEEHAATDLGLTYYNLPISRGGDSLDAETLKRASQLVGQHRGTGILLHCSTGNRAAAWFAVHLAQDQGMEIGPSLELAHSAGLTSPGMESRVRAYLSQ